MRKTIILLFSALVIALLFAPLQEEAFAYNAAKAQAIIQTGKKYYGTPYRFGSSSYTTKTFDCSSFTQRVYYENGIKLPRTSRQQAKVGTYVSKNNILPGDLLFFDTNRDGVIDHVGIYAGNQQLLHTYKVGIGVTLSKITPSNYWGKTYVTARRVL